MRYVIYGAGAIGGVLGGRLRAAGHDVVLIARGAQLAAFQRDGLRLQSRDHDDVHRLTAVGSPAEAGIGAGDVVVLAMKTQDTADALERLAEAAPPTTPVFCAQNGVENERLAARHFSNVYGMYVFIFAAALDPGVVQCHTEPSGGVCDVGRYPTGTDALAEHVAADLVGAGFEAVANAAIMRWKYTKLLANLGNVLQVFFGQLDAVPDLYAALRTEAEAVYRAAGIDYVPWDEQLARYTTVLPLTEVNGRPFPGGSSWQSVVKGSARVETDYLNGEIALLGHLAGVPTPLNELVQHKLRSYLRDAAGVGAMGPDDLRAEMKALGATSEQTLSGR